MTDELVHRDDTDLDGGRLATLTLDSPHNRNALSRQLVTELFGHLEAAEADPSVRVVLVTSADRVFCSGADLSEATADGMEEGARRIVALQQLQRDIQAEWFQRAIGSIEDVLVDSISRRRESDVAGRTSGNTIVNFPGPAAWLGSLRRVRVVETAKNRFEYRGEAA